MVVVRSQGQPCQGIAQRRIEACGNQDEIGTESRRCALKSGKQLVRVIVSGKAGRDGKIERRARSRACSGVCRTAAARVVGGLVHRQIEDVGILVEDGLAAVPVMDVPINDQNALYPLLLSVARADRHVAEQAKPHRPVGRGVVPRRPDWAERVARCAGEHGVDRAEEAPHCRQGGVPRTFGNDGVGIQARPASAIGSQLDRFPYPLQVRARMDEQQLLFRCMAALAQDRVISERCLFLLYGFQERLQAPRVFRVPRPRVVTETIRMGHDRRGRVHPLGSQQRVRPGLTRGEPGEQVPMSAPEVRGHRDHRDEVADQHFRPADRTEHRLDEGEHVHVVRELEENEQEKEARDHQHRGSLEHGRSQRHNEPGDDEGRPMYEGIAGNQRRRRLGQAAQLDCGPALEDARTENGRRIERLAGQCVEDKKPDRDRCGADHSAKEAFTGDRQHRRLGNHRGGRGCAAHDPSW